MSREVRNFLKNAESHQARLLRDVTRAAAQLDFISIAELERVYREAA
jgi:hypothetical protein